MFLSYLLPLMTFDKTIQGRVTATAVSVLHAVLRELAGTFFPLHQTFALGVSNMKLNCVTQNCLPF